MEKNPDPPMTEDNDPADKKLTRLGNFSSREEQAWWEEHIIFG